MRRKEGKEQRKGKKDKPKTKNHEKSKPEKIVIQTPHRHAPATNSEESCLDACVPVRVWCVCVWGGGCCSCGFLKFPGRLLPFLEFFFSLFSHVVVFRGQEQGCRDFGVEREGRRAGKAPGCYRENCWDQAVFFSIVLGRIPSAIPSAIQESFSGCLPRKQLCLWRISQQIPKRGRGVPTSPLRRRCSDVWSGGCSCGVLPFRSLG